jgi:hypothetical protein
MDRPKLDRSKIVAIITGVISILISIAYLVLVQLLDMRGEMIPAPTSLNPEMPTVERVAIVSINSKFKIQKADSELCILHSPF